MKCVPIPQKIYGITKRLKTSDEVEQYFSVFLAFIDTTEQRIPRSIDKTEKIYSILAKRKNNGKDTVYS